MRDRLSTRKLARPGIKPSGEFFGPRIDIHPRPRIVQGFAITALGCGGVGTFGFGQFIDGHEKIIGVRVNGGGVGAGGHGGNLRFSFGAVGACRLLSPVPMYQRYHQQEPLSSVLCGQFRRIAINRITCCATDTEQRPHQRGQGVRLRYESVDRVTVAIR